jgi:hypothetical protein
LEITTNDVIFSTQLAVGFTLVMCVVAILPRRRTNAFYLRSFRNDARTGPIRLSVQNALGSAFRLSGIRDPNRRWGHLLRHLFYVLFVIRYASPKYMNLEAGPDWKQRLWRSFGDARCAVIDVSDLTPFVREEIELTVSCLGYQRVLFVADDSRQVEEWRQAVREAAGSDVDPSDQIQVVVWSKASGRREFKDQVRKFAASLPNEPAPLNPSAYPAIRSTTRAPAQEFQYIRPLNPSADPAVRPATHAGNWWTWHWEEWAGFVLANLIGLGLVEILGSAARLTPELGRLWLLPGIALYGLVFLLLAQYFVQCGSNLRRVRLVGVFAFGAFASGLLPWIEWTSPPSGPNIVAAEMQIREIDQALWIYQLDHGEFPENLQVLPEFRPRSDPILPARAPLDPWNKPYHYNSAGPNNKGQKPDVWTVTPEWLAGSSANKVIGNWKGHKK